MVVEVEFDRAGVAGATVEGTEVAILARDRGGKQGEELVVQEVRELFLMRVLLISLSALVIA